MKLDLKKTINSLDGNPLKDAEGAVVTVGSVLANVMLGTKAEGKMRLYNLAQKFYNDKAIELEAPDLALVKKAVQENETFNALVLGQIELLLQ